MIKAAICVTQKILLVREKHVTIIERAKIKPKENNRGLSSLSFRNKPYGVRSTLTCMANMTREKTMGVDVINAPPIMLKRDLAMLIVSSVKKDFIELWHSNRAPCASTAKIRKTRIGFHIFLFKERALYKKFQNNA